MVDNVAVTPGTGATFATDDIGGIQYPRVKIAQGADGTGVDVSSAAPLNVTLANGTVPSHAVTNAGTFATQVTTVNGVAPAFGTGVRGATVQRVTVATDDVVPVTIASVPSHAVTNAGTFAVQNTAATPAGTNNIGDVDVLTINGVAPAFNSGANGATVLRVGLATDSPGVIATAAPGTLTAAGPSVTAVNPSHYETVAASQTAQSLGATGATGDFINGILVVPATTSPGNVLLLDNATSITVFTGGATSVSNLVPFFIPLGMTSVSGAWKITTGANVSCIGVGKFT